MTEPAKLPYRWKYLMELPAFRSWFLYGESADSSHVDLNDGYQDVIIELLREDAKAIIEAREQYLDVVCEINKRLGGHG